MQAEIYQQIPDSGTVPEHRFVAEGNCTWVRFQTDSHDEWAGVFGNGGVVQHSKAVVFADNRTALIIAGGQGYVIDMQDKTLLHKTACDHLCDAIAVPSREFVIACDFTDLYAVSRNRVTWHSPRIALDGIQLDDANETMLEAKARQANGWRRFTLRYDGWHIDDAPA